MSFQLRQARSEDAAALRELQREAVLAIGPRAYSPEQVRVWAMFGDDLEEYRERLMQGVSLLAECEGRIAAVGQLWPDDHIERLYTFPEFAGRGLATALLSALEQVARERGVVRVTTEASHIARPVFERSGYRVVELEIVERRGVQFERFKMEKAI